MIQLNNLTKLYKNKRGIRNISLEIPDGEILGLLGPNGSGKTTIMKALLSLIAPDSGEILVDGKPLRENFENVMAFTGALIESPAIFKDMTAAENLRLSLRDKTDILDIDRILQVVHLERYKNDKAGRFSLGMKQRLGLAAALIGKPRLVILDEPVNGLDIEGVVEIREYIKKMNNEIGTTFIISSHIASEIERLCTSVAVIYDGEIIARDSTSHIMSRYPSMEDYFLEQVRERRGGI
jgi:ABC-2 type transport system ATP-binding protein